MINLIVEEKVKYREENLKRIYGGNPDFLSKQIIRYENITLKFQDKFGFEPEYYFSSPGRTEICGNHTDHNHGKVIAASINLDTIAAVLPANDMKVEIWSEGYENSWLVDLNNLDKIDDEDESTASLVRGIASFFNNLGLKIGGFKAYLSSNVMIGSGLSSSASVEVLIGQIFNNLYNSNSVDPVTIAKAGQFAENKYFGKPCGLMDQIACATGGMVKIDFQDPEKPMVEKIDFSIGDYCLAVVDTGGNHADLTEDYASIPTEMKKVANLLGKEYGRDLHFSDVVKNFDKIREQVGDRAILRIIHFLNENERVEKMSEAMKDNSVSEFLSIVKESGDSSFKWLQNCYTHHNINEQGISLALALTEQYCNNTTGVCRVHGGGFAGTILTVIREELFENYSEFIENVFGEGSVLKLNIRLTGVTNI